MSPQQQARHTVRLCPREQQPAPGLSRQSVGAAGMVRHRGWGHCCHHHSALSALGNKKQSSPWPSAGKRWGVFSCPVWFCQGTFLLSANNSLCEPAHRCVPLQSLSVSLCWDYLPANKLLWSEIKGKTSSPLRTYPNIFATLCFMENMGRCCIHDISLISVFVNRFITPSAESYCHLLHIHSLSIYIVQLLFILFPFYN